MKTLKIDETFNPLNNIEYVENTKMVRQNIQDRLKILKGELDYNTSIGIPIGLHKESVDIAVIDIIRKTTGVVSAYFIQKSTLVQGRHYHALVNIITEYNTELQMEI